MAVHDYKIRKYINGKIKVTSMKYLRIVLMESSKGEKQ